MFKKRRPYRRLMLFGIIVLLLSGAYLFVDRQIRPTLFAVAQVEVTQLAVGTMNKVVQEQTANSNLRYQDFITVSQDYHGRVAMMQANTMQINQFAAGVTIEVQKQLQSLEVKKITIPLGQVLGSYLLADFGPKFTVHMHPIGTVNVDVLDQFEQAGINQTRHKIYLSFQTMVKVVIPIYSGEVKVTTKVPVAESIIVGDVPEAVINFPGGMLNVDK